MMFVCCLDHILDGLPMFYQFVRRYFKICRKCFHISRYTIFYNDCHGDVRCYDSFAETTPKHQITFSIFSDFQYFRVGGYGGALEMSSVATCDQPGFQGSSWAPMADTVANHGIEQHRNWSRCDRSYSSFF